MQNVLIDEAKVVVTVVVKVVSVLAKSKVSLVSIGSSYLVFELVSSIGRLEFQMTDNRGETSLACTFE